MTTDFWFGCFLGGFFGFMVGGILIKIVYSYAYRNYIKGKE